MPFLSIAHHTFPCTTGGRAERELVVVRLKGFETEDLNAGSGRFMELQARLYHARVIINKERMRRDIVAYVVEEVFTDLTVAIDQQFAVVTFGQGVLGYPLIRQGIVKISDIDWSLAH